MDEKGERFLTAVRLQQSSLHLGNNKKSFLLVVMNTAGGWKRKRTFQNLFAEYGMAIIYADLKHLGAYERKSSDRHE